MSRFGELGQLTEIFSLANQAQLSAANALLARERQKKERKLAEKDIKHRDMV